MEQPIFFFRTGAQLLLSEMVKRCENHPGITSHAELNLLEKYVKNVFPIHRDDSAETTRYAIEHRCRLLQSIQNTKQDCPYLYPVTTTLSEEQTHLLRTIAAYTDTPHRTSFKKLLLLEETIDRTFHPITDIYYRTYLFDCIDSIRQTLLHNKRDVPVYKIYHNIPRITGIRLEHHDIFDASLSSSSDLSPCQRYIIEITQRYKEFPHRASLEKTNSLQKKIVLFFDDAQFKPLKKILINAIISIKINVSLLVLSYKKKNGPKNIFLYKSTFLNTLNYLLFLFNNLKTIPQDPLFHYLIHHITEAEPKPLQELIAADYDFEQRVFSTLCLFQRYNPLFAPKNLYANTEPNLLKTHL